MKKVILLIVWLVLCVLLLSCVSSSVTETEKKRVTSPGGEELFEDFEETHNFIVVGDFRNAGDNSLVALTSNQHATSGKKALECQFEFQPNQKGAAFYGEGFEKFDWSGYTHLILDVYNATGEELTSAFAVCTGTAWTWIESEPFPLSAGKNNNFTFALTTKTFKSDATNWKNTATLENMDDVKRLIFKISGPVGLKGSVFIDNIRIAK